MDNNHTPQELLNFWKKGKDLYSALYEFTDLAIRQECEELESKRNIRSQILLENVSSEISNILTEGIIGINQAIHLNNEIDNARIKLKWDLSNKIIAEKLIGLGYEAPVKSTDYPKIIPLHIWPQKINEINWENSSISQNGIQFLNIRIIKKIASSKNKIDKKIMLPKIEVKDKKIGRPSIKAKIITAYEWLKRENKIDYSQTLKAHTELIQKTVQKLFPEIKTAKGMEYEAMRRAIGTVFQEDRTSKSTSKL